MSSEVFGIRGYHERNFRRIKTDCIAAGPRNARRQNALIKDHQLTEELHPLIMDSGGVSSLFPKKLGDMFSLSGESGTFSLVDIVLNHIFTLQGKMPSSFALTTTSHMVRGWSSLQHMLLTPLPFPCKVENVSSEREDNLNAFMHHVGTKFHLQPPPPREPFKPLQFAM